MDPKFENVRLRRSLFYKRKRWAMPLVCAGILVALTLIAPKNEPNLSEPVSVLAAEKEQNAVIEVQDKVFSEIPAPDTPPVQEVESVVPSYEKTIEVAIKSGDSLYEILMKNGLPSSEIHKLVSASKPVHDLGRLQRGQTFVLAFDERDGRVQKFETQFDGEHRLVVELEGKKLSARKEKLEFDVHHEIASGTINDSLFLAARRVDFPPPMILELAEIFAWDIDFSVDMRKGDTFRILYEKKYLDNHFSSNGRILAAEIINKGRKFTAYYFRGSNGRADYYESDGSSLRKAFLKSPLDYKYISSHFSHRRFHPILKIYRPHLGVDYAAPTGTPVHSVGDGVVAYAGRKGGYGRYVKIRHNETYSTTYGHLYRYGKGIRSGTRVTQGQVIGYVGSSGLSTGPHLDFRMLKKDVYINPLKVNMPDADPVDEQDMPEFQEGIAEFSREMDDIQNQELFPDTLIRTVALKNNA